MGIERKPRWVAGIRPPQRWRGESHAHQSQPSQLQSASPPKQFQSSRTLCGLGRGEIQLHQREGKPLPPGAGIDPEGNPTTDPDAALAGAQLPFGGHKGAAIAMMVELLAAGLTGSQLSFEAADADPDWKGPSRHGELIILIDPAVVRAATLSELSGAT